MPRSSIVDPEPPRPGASRLRWCLLLDGEAVVTVDGAERRAPVGTTIHLPGDVEHGVRTTGGPVRLLFVFPAAAFDDIVYRLR